MIRALGQVERLADVKTAEMRSAEVHSDGNGARGVRKASLLIQNRGDVEEAIKADYAGNG
jgi:hypothetical protein